MVGSLDQGLATRHPQPASFQDRSAEERLRHTRAIATSLLAPLVELIDREGLYPRQVLQKLARAGAFSAHLRSYGEGGDLGLSIQLIAQIARVCGSTGFLAWCQAACGLCLEESDNPALQGEPLARHLRGDGFGGTALANPIKFYAGIEELLLRATPDGEGYRLRGSLPWVSHFQPDGYCGVIASVVASDGTPAGQEVMVLLSAATAGVDLIECPDLSGVEGTCTCALHLNDVRIGPEAVIARDAATFIAGIRPAVVLLQCGLGLGVSKGAIESILAVEGRLGHINRHLAEQAEPLQAELDGLWGRILLLALTPRRSDLAYRLAVLKARAHCSELSLRAAQAALLHQGSCGFLACSPVQRRIRESHVVAIVTPSLKQLHKEIADLEASGVSRDPQLGSDYTERRPCALP